MSTDPATGLAERPAADGEARFYDSAGTAGERSFPPAPRLGAVAGVPLVTEAFGSGARILEGR